MESSLLRKRYSNIPSLASSRSSTDSKIAPINTALPALANASGSYSSLPRGHHQLEMNRDDLLACIDTALPLLHNASESASSLYRMLETAKNEIIATYGHGLEELGRLEEVINAQLQVAREQENKVIRLLEKQKKKLGKKLKFVKAGMILSRVAFAMAIVGVPIAAAVVVTPPVAAIVGAVVAVPLGSLGTWVDSRWKKREHTLKEQRESVGEMLRVSCQTINDLDLVKVMFDEFVVQIHYLPLDAAPELDEEEGGAVFAGSSTSLVR